MRDLLETLSYSLSDPTMVTVLNAEWLANPKNYLVAGEKPPTAGL